MELNNTNEKTRTFWECACRAIKFEKEGLWGLKSPSGDIVLAPEYDKVEVCTDFVYVHYDNRHKYFYKNGSTSDCADREDDDRFYENGKIGILHQDGSVFLPAIYDEIIDWGMDSDVVYVRNGKEYHYFNHNGEEILTDVRVIPEDAYPECPYNLGEDQNREVLLCVEPIKGREDNRSCFTYGQWCRLSRIPRKDIRSMFADCDVFPMPQDAIDHFHEEDTYIYSARICKAKSLEECIKKIQTLGCYNSSWTYLVKITTNSYTQLDPYDLHEAIKHFENLENCIDFHISIGTDENLKDGEIEFFQIHFFWDDMGAFLHDGFKQIIIPEGSIKEIDEALELMDCDERKVLLSDAFWWIKHSDNRDWAKTEGVLNHFIEIGAKDISMLLDRHLEINPFWIEEVTPEEWIFKKRIIEWAMKHGVQLNSITNGKTGLEEFIQNLEDAKRYKENEPDAQESIKNAEIFLDWLKSIGAVSASEQRMKVKSKLEGLSPKAVFKLVSTI